MNSFILPGIDAICCEVEIDAARHGLEHAAVVGLAQAAAKERFERVRRAGCSTPRIPERRSFTGGSGISMAQKAA